MMKYVQRKRLENFSLHQRAFSLSTVLATSKKTFMKTMKIERKMKYIKYFHPMGDL